MPIVRYGDSVYLEYSIPKEVDQKIPKYFYFAMAGELCSISGPWLFDKINDGDGVEYYDLHSGTSGWAAAFYATCKKLDMMWLYEYAVGLNWYDCDMFDGEIEKRIVKAVMKSKGNSANEYYKYVIDKVIEEGKIRVRN